MNYVLKLNTCPNNPAYSRVYEPNSFLFCFEKSNLTPPLRPRILPLRIKKLTWVWLMTSQCQTFLLRVNLNQNLSLTNLIKDRTNPEICKQAILEMTAQRQKSVLIFTYGFKVDEKVAAAVLSSVAKNTPFSR